MPWRKHKKYLTFSASINKEPENRKTITYKMKFIDSVRFMPSLLSSLADNLSEGLITINSNIVSLILNTYYSRINYGKTPNKDPPGYRPTRI